AQERRLVHAPHYPCLARSGPRSDRRVRRRLRGPSRRRLRRRYALRTAGRQDPCQGPTPWHRRPGDRPGLRQPGEAGNGGPGLREDGHDPAQGHRRYGRTVADVILPDGRSLNRELVAEGMAWWYRTYAPGDRGLERA